MSLNKQPKTSLGHLPKSVKVRSTCNACQQAKIRCSHEKPSCRRCQKHKIDCIYSVSRRLGRPAKKKDPRPELQERSVTLSSNTPGHPDREKKTRKCAKKKGNCATSITPVRPRTSRTPAKSKVEDQPQPSILEAGVNEPTGFEIDFSSDNWLQELMPPSFEPDPGNLTLESLYEELDMEDTFDAMSECGRYPGSLFSQPAADRYLCSASSGPHMALAQMTFDSDISALSNPVKIDRSESMMFENAGSVAWPYDPASRLRVQSFPNPWTAENVAPMEASTHLSNSCNHLKSPGVSQESDTFSPRDAGYFAVLEGGPAFSCSCYKQAMSELVRSGLRTSPDGLSSIESILTCQKDLLLQTESILQCKVCSQSEGQANMLMVIILTIDSLLTTLDATATLAKAEVADELSSSEDQIGVKKQKESGGGLKSRIDACPLLVGAFTVPPEEKICFIRQVLQARLSMLLMTIRRIRLCMQEHLTGALSRGRLLMIMETDRRLQLIMMKVKMAVG